jgi:hypothetical protein
MHIGVYISEYLALFPFLLSCSYSANNCRIICKSSSQNGSEHHQLRTQVTEPCVREAKTPQPKHQRCYTHAITLKAGFKHSNKTTTTKLSTLRGFQAIKQPHPIWTLSAINRLQAKQHSKLSAITRLQAFWRCKLVEEL